MFLIVLDGTYVGFVIAVDMFCTLVLILLLLLRLVLMLMVMLIMLVQKCIYISSALSSAAIPWITGHTPQFHTRPHWGAGVNLETSEGRPKIKMEQREGVAFLPQNDGLQYRTKMYKDLEKFQRFELNPKTQWSD